MMFLVLNSSSKYTYLSYLHLLIMKKGNIIFVTLSLITFQDKSVTNTFSLLFCFVDSFICDEIHKYNAVFKFKDESQHTTANLSNTGRITSMLAYNILIINRKTEFSLLIFSPKTFYLPIDLIYICRDNSF